MAIYDRMLGLALPRIGVHAFFSVMQEYALGNMTGAQAVAAFNLDANEQTEATTLLNTILAVTDADPTLQRLKRVAKALEFEQVLIVGAAHIAPYWNGVDSSAVKTRLGV